MLKIIKIKENPLDWIEFDGTLARAFPVKAIKDETYLDISEKDIFELSDNFNKSLKNSPFENTGLLANGKIITFKSEPNYKGDFSKLSDVIVKNEVNQEFYIDENSLNLWKYLKGAKKIKRRTKSGYEYSFSEGSMAFPDSLDNPSRTIITGEGGKSPSRFKHIIKTIKGYRRLTPVELERLNGFPDNHTKLKGITNAKRAFFMGNALVCGVVEKIGESLVDN